MVRTDMASESVARAGDARTGGVSSQVSIDERAQVKIERIHIFTDEAARVLGKPVGRYVTITLLDDALDAFSERAEFRARAIAAELVRLMDTHGRTLVAGLGNRDITPDAVGPLCADRIFATRHIKKLAPELDGGELNEVCAIQTGVLGQTGIEASDIVKAVCTSIGADSVIAVDALACAQAETLGRTIQLTDTGISPGSGVANSRKELSRRTLGADCVAVGIPTVIDYGEGEGAMMVTPRSIDALVRNGAEYVSAGINLALQPSLDYADLHSLV